MSGPNERELANVLKASETALGAAAADWEAGRTALAEVTHRLRQGADGMNEQDGEGGPNIRRAAVGSFEAMQRRVRDHREALRKGRSAFDIASQAVSAARRDQAALPPLQYDAKPGGRNPGTVGAESRGAPGGSQVSQESADARERAAGAALVRFDTEMERAIEKMREARGDDPRRPGGVGADGAGGATTDAPRTSSGGGTYAGGPGLAPGLGDPDPVDPDSTDPTDPDPGDPGPTGSPDPVPDPGSVPTPPSDIPSQPGGDPTAPLQPGGAVPVGTGPFGPVAPIGGSADTGLAGGVTGAMAGGVLAGSAGGSIVSAVRNALAGRALRAGATGTTTARAASAARAGATTRAAGAGSRAIGSTSRAARASGGVMGRSTGKVAARGAGGTGGAAGKSGGKSAGRSAGKTTGKTTGSVTGRSTGKVAGGATTGKPAATSAGPRSGGRAGGVLGRPAAQSSTGGRGTAGPPAARRRRDRQAPPADHLLLQESWLDDEDAGPQTLA